MIRSSLLDQDPDELELVLRKAGRLDKAPDAARRRALVGVGGAAAASAGVALTSISSSAAAAPIAVHWLLAMKWAAVGLAAGAVTLGTAASLSHRPTSSLEARAPIAAPPSVAAAPRLSPANVVAANPSLETADDSTSSTHEVSATSALAAPRVNEAPKTVAEIQPRASAPVAVSSAHTGAASSLERELKLLEDARLALDSHAPARALTALDRYAEGFPAGGMRIEATALRVETLLSLGRRDEAQALGRSFLSSYPRSPAAIRVRRLVGDASKGDGNANR